MPVEIPVGPHCVAVLVLVRHCLGKFRESFARIVKLAYLLEHADRCVVCFAPPAIAVLCVERFSECVQPEKIVVGAVYPKHTGMIYMRRLVGGSEPSFVQARAQYLHTLENHFDNVLVTVKPRTALNVSIKNKDVHGAGSAAARAFSTRRTINWPVPPG